MPVIRMRPALIAPEWPGDFPLSAMDPDGAASGRRQPLSTVNVAAEPEAFWFGRGRPRCFGMLHRPETAPTRGVVICNGLGYEGLISGRPLARLAGRLAAQGYAVLRFDYEGAGDSEGGDWEPGRIEAWFGSIDAAVGVLRARQGIEEMYLVGIRMGATLACLYADDHPGIAGLALWAPCANGGRYVRELRALSRLSGVARPPQRVTADWFPEDSVEVAGFEVGSATAQDLRSLDLESLRWRPAPAVLVVDHADRPCADALVGKLLELGTEVEHARVAGYTDFMVDDETKSVLPVEALDQLTAWFARARPRCDRINTDPPAVSPSLVIAEPAPGRPFPPGPERPPVVEKASRFPGGLFAIVTEPADKALRRRVAVVILNTGLTNRVGQGRLSTEQARYWASLGFTVVRVDLGDTGDSPMRSTIVGQTIYEPERIKEVIRVVDCMRVHGDARHVVLFGICSGAYQAFHAVLEGADVETAILVNPSVWYDDEYRQAGQEILVARNSARAVLRLEQWRRIFREPRRASGSIRQAATGFTHLARIRAGARPGEAGMEVPGPMALSKDLNRLARSGIDLLIVFAAGETGAEYLRTFGGKTLVALQPSQRFRIVDIEGGDHVFSSPGARQRLIEVVTNHLEQSYPRNPSAVSATGAGVANSARCTLPGGGGPLLFDELEFGGGQT